MWKYGNVFLRQKFSNWKRSVSWRVIVVQHPVVCNVRLDSLDPFSNANGLLEFCEPHFYISPFLLRSSWHSFCGLLPSQLVRCSCVYCCQLLLLIVTIFSDITASIGYFWAFTSEDVFLFLGGPMNTFNLQCRRFSQRSSSAKITQLLGPQHEGANVYQNVDNYLPIYTA